MCCRASTYVKVSTSGSTRFCSSGRLLRWVSAVVSAVGLMDDGRWGYPTNVGCVRELSANLHHIYIMCCKAFLVAARGTGRDVPADERIAAAHNLMAAPVDDTLQLAYPDVYDVTRQDGDWGTEQAGKVRAGPQR